MKTGKSKLCLALAATVATLMFTGSAAAQDSLMKTVKIGFAGPLTGISARDGKDMRNAVQMAIDEANSKKLYIEGRTIQFELLSEDDKSDPKIAAQVAQRLVNAGVVGVVGHYNSGCSISASKVYNDAGLPQITPVSTNPKYTLQGYKTTFRTIGHDGASAAFAGNYAVKNFQAQHIVVIDDRTPFGQGLADEFVKAVKAASDRVPTREFVDDKTTDFNAILANTKHKNADLIFFAGADVQAASLARQMKALGMSNATLMGASGMASQAFLDLAHKDGDGAISFESGLPFEKMLGGKRFAAKYKAKYHASMESYAPFAFDAANALIEAMKEANSTDPARYLPVLAVNKFIGVTGLISFDAHGDLLYSAYTLYRAENGKWNYLRSMGGVTYRR